MRRYSHRRVRLAVRSDRCGIVPADAGLKERLLRQPGPAPVLRQPGGWIVALETRPGWSPGCPGRVSFLLLLRSGHEPVRADRRWSGVLPGNQRGPDLLVGGRSKGSESAGRIVFDAGRGRAARSERRDTPGVLRGRAPLHQPNRDALLLRRPPSRWW